VADTHVIRQEDPFWIHYKANRPNEDRIAGKFMTFGIKPVDDKTISAIEEAVETGIVNYVKHSNTESGHINPNSRDPDSYVICWYSSDDRGQLQRLAEFLVKKDMIQKTKKDRLYNISFKYDDQTRAGEYGDSFEAKISLSEFIDLDSGESRRKS
jgi:hypothetical protein